MSQSSIEQQFGNAAANYRTSAVHARGTDLQSLVTAAHLNETQRVLDVGCGAGHATLAVAPQVHEVVAYDLTAAMLQQVRLLADERQVSNVRVQRGDVHRLPFPANAFDRVVSRYSAHHWDAPQEAVVEIARVLREGGRFVLSDVVAPDEARSDSVLQTLEMLRDPSHVRDHSAQQWQAMFEQAGFRVSIALAFDVPLHFGNWLARINTPPIFAQALRELFAGLSAEQRKYFGLPATLPEGNDFSFKLAGAVIVGVLD